MKLATKLIYFSLCLATILLLQTIESKDQNLDLQTYKAELCVDFFKDGSGSLVTQDDRDKAEQILSSLYDENIWDNIVDLINTQSFDAAVVNNLLRYIVPWAVFLLISLVGWIFYCCYCICDKKCPPSNCCKRDYNEKKLEKKEFYIPIAFAIVLNLLLGGASIAGLVNAGDVERGLKAARCSLVALFSDINNSQGAADITFPGLNKLGENIKAISNQLVSFQSNLTKTFSDGTSAKIKSKKEGVIKTNDDMKRGATNAAVPVLDTGAGAESYLSSMNFVDYILLSSADSNKASIAANYQTLSGNAAYSSYIKCTPQPEALAAYYDALVEVASQLESTSSSIASSSFDSAAINSGSDTINKYIADIEKSGTDLYDSTKSLEQYGGYVSLALNVLFGVSLGLSVVSLISIILILLLKMYQLRGLIHFAWCIYVILMILCFILALLLHPTSVIFAEVCQYMEKFLKEETFFNDAKFVDSGDTKNIISSCFFPSTTNTLYTVMKLDDAMKPLNNFTAYLTAFQASFANMNTSKSDFQTKLNDNLAAVQGAKEGTVFDVSSSLLSDYQNSFSAFNSLKSNSGCVELAVATCADGKKPMKSSADTGSAYNTNCWHPAYLAASSPACTQQSGSTDTTKLKAQYQKQSTMWNDALTKEKNLLSQNDAVSADFDAYMTKINNFVTGAQALVDDLQSLLKGINCTFLRLSFQNVIDGLCVIFIPGISRTTVLIIIIAVSMFFGSLSNCCIGLRAYRIKEYGLKGEGSSKIQPNNGDQEMVAITKGQS